MERKGESVIGRNPQQMRVIKVEGLDTVANCTPNTSIRLVEYENNYPRRVHDGTLLHNLEQ